MKYEKLSDYAKRMGIKYQTAWKWYDADKIDGAIMKNKRVFVPLPDGEETPRDPLIAATYARVSSSQNKSNLESQSQRLYDYSTARGYQVVRQVKETGSGLNDSRSQLESLLKDDSWSILVIEHKDRLTRFGYHYLELLVESQGRRIEVINKTNSDDKSNVNDLIEDLVSIITSFTARIYGRRRSQRKTEKLIEELRGDTHGDGDTPIHDNQESS